jgi:hypothetical protein
VDLPDVEAKVQAPRAAEEEKLFPDVVKGEGPDRAKLQARLETNWAMRQATSLKAKKSGNCVLPEMSSLKSAHPLVPVDPRVVLRSVHL